MRKRVLLLAILVVVIVAGLLLFAALPQRPKPGTVKDEALTVGREVASFPAADEDYFAEMDYGVSKNPEVVRARLAPYMQGILGPDAVDHFVKGRNNWNVWTGGNDRLWNELFLVSFGTIDLLKTVSSHPKMRYGRHKKNRWIYLGLVNEPCFQTPRAPRQDRFGLWLDERIVSPECPPTDPFENERKYPGVRIGARGKNIPVGSFYGYASGILGLRLFPNPAFDEKAQAKWDPERYYTDPSYYNDKDIIKPYRVGMSCGFCHIGPNPSNPPADPENPKWENLNSNPGAQYFWVDRIFVWNPVQMNFAYQLFHTSRPGALDTSFVSSDQINNPRTMNAIYSLPARLEMAQHWGEEQIASGELDNKQFNDYPGLKGPLYGFYDPATKKVKTPRVLKDGSDSVGALGALNRVYINIGLFSEEWMLHFIPLLGGPKITPILIKDAEKNSSYWKATEAQTPDVALFFLSSATPDLLSVAQQNSGSPNFLSTDAAQLDMGKEVFAERCARCHSSKLPQKAYKNYLQGSCMGPNYLKCWDDYWKWTKTADFKEEMKRIVKAPDFLANNALTTDARVPVTLLETNACSPLATNAIRGDIWDNFASQSYKDLPSVGKVLVQHPYTGAVREYEMAGGGRGYTRPPSLASVWATAPFLVNNSLGKFHASGSVPARIASFEDSITKLLWPERRDGGEQVVTRSGLVHPGHIDRLPEKAYLMSGPKFLPGPLQGLPNALGTALPNVFSNGSVKLGPFPKGTPVSLVSNVDMKELLGVLGFAVSFQRYLEAVSPDSTDAQAAKLFSPLVPKLLEISKCPDYIVNKGHYFGTAYLPAQESEPPLTDVQKRALIEFIKTF
ncbi:MAG TPA: hypothetical protein VFV49_02645 [Thermoanaerobaculia bacterium]|nr:hypothetical protein [Thermoanaerobaculia bacterium]